jgi:hypothetical protein
MQSLQIFDLASRLKKWGNYKLLTQNLRLLSEAKDRLLTNG